MTGVDYSLIFKATETLDFDDLFSETLAVFDSLKSVDTGESFLTALSRCEDPK